MNCRQRMAEEGFPRTVRRLSWAPILRTILVLFLFSLVIYSVAVCSQYLSRHHGLESTEWDIAELQLNYTGTRLDPRLHWQGGPALGRSFLHGPLLKNGQLCVQRDGIYRLHIQMTLTNCSFSSTDTVPRRAILTVGLCSPGTDSVSLLRLNFQLGCTVASQRLTRLTRGDTLCTNLTLPLLPSPNADETFFGIQWIHP